jgi:hypothetical protein
MTLPRFDNACPTVWMLDAGTLNVHSIGEGNDSVVAVPGEASKPYLPDALWDDPDDAAETARFPIAIFPPRVDARLAAQQGVFTLHGNCQVSIDDLAAQDHRIRLAAIVLSASSSARMWDELRLAGLSEMSLFPDLDHIAHHVKRSYER